jgi:competence CoiA-like predicted nuclease
VILKLWVKLPKEFYINPNNQDILVIEIIDPFSELILLKTPVFTSRNLSHNESVLQVNNKSDSRMALQYTRYCKPKVTLNLCNLYKEIIYTNLGKVIIQLYN